ncbi:MAG: YtxH domain-containing protein [Clostridia bacterium]|nr:YtxH domain-containing protein [Clostridia bacterium]
MSENKGGFFTGVVFGAILGGITALLLTPNTGEKNRDILKKRGNEIKDAILEKGKEIGIDLNQTEELVEQKYNEYKDSGEKTTEMVSEEMEE